jgi:myo-inositol-1(or 4)-monophosphatase
MENLEYLCLEACKIVTETANFINSKLGNVQKSEIEEKSLNSLVSFVDRTAEAQLVEGLSRLLPGSVFLTEEETVIAQSGDYKWIIDPLDGTTNFLRQLPYFAISVALQYQQQTVVGVVYEVVRKECFYAWRNGGAFINGKKIKVSENSELKNSLIGTGLPDKVGNWLPNYLKAYEYFQQNTLGLRRYGAAAIDMVYVACGRFDAYFQYGLYPWDVAAGALIVQEAGGTLSDFKGGENYLFGKEMIASNSLVSASVLAIIQSIFY